MFNKVKITLLACLFVCTGSLLAEMPEPYRSINDLPFDSQGWFINQHQIDAIVKNLQPMTVIEVGSWIGSSTRFIAQRLPKGGKLFAVDTWNGSPDEEVHMTDSRLPYLFQLFLSNVKHAGLTEVIVPIQMDSLEAAKALGVQADLIYIDASHDTESVYNDIMAWYPHLNDNGVFCGDDWGWPSVREAVIRAAHDLNLTVVPGGWFWSYK